MRMQEAMAALAAGPVVDTAAIKTNGSTTPDKSGRVTGPTTSPQRTVSLG